MAADKHCADCRYFAAPAQSSVTEVDRARSVLGQRPLMGRCRRFPQAVEKAPAEWCGEFRPIEKLELQC